MGDAGGMTLEEGEEGTVATEDGELGDLEVGRDRVAERLEDGEEEVADLVGGQDAEGFCGVVERFAFGYAGAGTERGQTGLEGADGGQPGVGRGGGEEEVDEGRREDDRGEVRREGGLDLFAPREPGVDELGAALERGDRGRDGGEVGLEGGEEGGQGPEQVAARLELGN